MRYLCIHGHFYQPPRENPWLEAIELQDSAYPYHDWNERITAECYAPNAAARILDGDGDITEISNNYSRISFNFGPTLLSWAKEHAPGLHQMIIDADVQSRTHFSGHGSAIAQCYNHMIMPLANARDKRTQIVWGIEDFRFRFLRDPEGMWLPETAVDLETLDLLAENGIKYTILAPAQAARIRPKDGSEWVDVTGARIDPTRPYFLTTPSGRRICLFFYDGPISRAVAFEGLLNNGEHFASRLLSAVSRDGGRDQLAHIATDGESYGHHHRYGEMALAYAIKHIEQKKLARITNYGEYLALHPPDWEAEIYEQTAWSCAHGVGRWQVNCGCNSGGHGGWDQHWRGPLRDALDWLRDQVSTLFEQHAKELLKDPWSARDAYIRVVLDRSKAARDAYLADCASRQLTNEEETIVWRLMELQRHAMLMYTSCGWFFDELSGIETVQVIMYAGRVVQIAERLFSKNIEDEFLRRLGKAKSNLPSHRDGAQIYAAQVKAAVVDAEKVAAHYAISSLFEEYGETARIYSYTVEREDQRVSQSGRLRMLIGRARFTGNVTQATTTISYGVLHFGDHNINAGVRQFTSDEGYAELVQNAQEAFARADLAEVIRLLDRSFEMNRYSLKSLFRDEQRKILSQILDSTITDSEALYRQLYENNAPLIRFLSNLEMPMPKAFRTTAEYALNSYLRRELSEDQINGEQIRRYLEEARVASVELDTATLEYQYRLTLERLASAFADDPTKLEALQSLEQAACLLAILPFGVTLWTAQNICWDVQRTEYVAQRQLAARNAEARKWVNTFDNLARHLSLETHS